ncbi:MAG: glycosyltransferase [Pirellulaceae bacterium]
MRVAQRVRQAIPTSRLVIIGTGPQEATLRAFVDQHHLENMVVFAGARSDIPECLSALDAFVLTSKMEASPVSILEALSVERPVVATAVGSIPESVIEGHTGYLASVDDDETLANRVIELLSQVELRQRLGRQGRAHVKQHGSLSTMVDGYCNLIAGIYDAKCAGIPFSPERLAAAPGNAAREPASELVDEVRPEPPHGTDSPRLADSAAPDRQALPGLSIESPPQTGSLV